MLASLTPTATPEAHVLNPLDLYMVFAPGGYPLEILMTDSPFMLPRIPMGLTATLASSILTVALVLHALKVAVASMEHV